MNIINFISFAVRFVGLLFFYYVQFNRIVRTTFHAYFILWQSAKCVVCMKCGYNTIERQSMNKKTNKPFLDDFNLLIILCVGIEIILPLRSHFTNRFNVKYTCECVRWQLHTSFVVDNC